MVQRRTTIFTAETVLVFNHTTILEGVDHGVKELKIQPKTVIVDALVVFLKVSKVVGEHCELDQVDIVNNSSIINDRLVIREGINFITVERLKVVIILVKTNQV